MKPFLCIFIIKLQIIFIINAQRLYFPEITNNYAGSPLNVRLPLFNHENCKDGELLYPVDEDRWVCDCKPGYLYVAEEDKCYRAYESGPCNDTSVLVLSTTDAFVAKCVHNECTLNGKVRLNGKCVKIGDPCQRLKKKRKTLGVVGLNEITMKLNCLPTGNKVYSKQCNKGGKLKFRGMCIR